MSLSHRWALIKLDHLLYILNEVNDKLRWKALKARAWAAIIATFMYTFGLSLQYIFDYNIWIACLSNWTMGSVYIVFLILSLNVSKSMKSFEGSTELIRHIENLLKK